MPAKSVFENRGREFCAQVLTAPSSGMIRMRMGNYGFGDGSRGVNKYTGSLTIDTPLGEFE